MQMACDGDGDGELVATAFVAKIYRMVNDPATDAVIGWGREDNSFVVLDPCIFSQIFLPSQFKHNSFSSFVRQLNTYGFRKVDPDRWEFAHACFLRGQTDLLRQIVRRRKGREEEEEDDDAVAMEVVRLKQEQREIGEKVDHVFRRLQEAERRPRQMLAFLVKLVGDPQLVGRLMARAGVGEGEGVGWKNRPKLWVEDGSSLPATLIPAAEAAAAIGLEAFGMGYD
ncbi:Heat stress transcription factor C-2a [Platanthera guangdongensis]|uniref:Heat stress transcription factor C-2a n=1 Tax=Platanthera guangdongensis TaxID=2320717 RepID=A0ABR2LGD7_9ASPA